MTEFIGDVAPQPTEHTLETETACFQKARTIAIERNIPLSAAMELVVDAARLPQELGRVLVFFARRAGDLN